MDNFGNQLNTIINKARNALFDQGELAQLTYGAFDAAAGYVRNSDEEEITISFPVGYRADKTTIDSQRSYGKDELLARYQFLAFHQLAVNGLVQLITIVEAALSDVVRAAFLKYPHKIGSKSSIMMKDILEASSIEEIHIRATDGILNDLSYKSPADFAKSLEQILSINILECTSFHKYMEIKATRDIFIHNRGIANEVYLRKAGNIARVKSGEILPADIPYFLESYESCLQMLEWVEIQLHDHWHSSIFEERKKLHAEKSLQEKQETEN